MSAIVFCTDLDGAQREVGLLNAGYQGAHIPQIGSHIKFSVETGRPYDLAVARVVYDVDRNTHVIELHLPVHWRGSINDWNSHMARIRTPHQKGSRL